MLVKLSIAVPELPARVRSARLRRGLSQTELGESVGWDKSLVSRIENGSYKASLSIDALMRLEKALGTKLFYGSDATVFLRKLRGDR